MVNYYFRIVSRLTSKYSKSFNKPVILFINIRGLTLSILLSYFILSYLYLHVLPLSNIWCYFLYKFSPPFQWQRSCILNKLMAVQLAVCAHTMLNFEKFLKISTQVHLMVAQGQDKITQYCLSETFKLKCKISKRNLNLNWIWSMFWPHGGIGC